MTPSNAKMVLIPQWDEERESDYWCLIMSWSQSVSFIVTMIDVMGIFMASFCTEFG